MEQCTFTICTKSYIGLAQVLENSIKKYNPTLDFFIFVVDEFNDNSELPSNILFIKDIFKDKKLWDEMSFKYNLVEFCTSLKPFCFDYVLNKLNYKKAIYFDPDILIFSSLNIILDLLDRYSIVLTPHISRIEEKYTGDLYEKTFLYAGSYNLGFCALRNSKNSNKFVSWWHNRLIDKCFINPHDSYFTDQCWIHMLPCFFSSEDLYISSHIGMNLAPWNYFEREILLKDSQLYVKSRRDSEDKLYDLIFVHFSGYDYKKLIDGIIYQRDILVKEYKDINILLDIYKEVIIAYKENFLKYIGLPYSYNCFEDGTPITLFHRRLYNGILLQGNKYEDLFTTNKEHSFYAQLKKNNLLSSFDVNTYAQNSKESIGQKRKRANKFLLFLYKLLGYRRFQMLIRFFENYSQYEKYTFLLDKKV